MLPPIITNSHLLTVQQNVDLKMITSYKLQMLLQYQQSTSKSASKVQ